MFSYHNTEIELENQSPAWNYLCTFLLERLKENHLLRLISEIQLELGLHEASSLIRQIDLCLNVMRDFIKEREDYHPRIDIMQTRVIEFAHLMTNQIIGPIREIFSTEYQGLEHDLKFEVIRFKTEIVTMIKKNEQRRKKFSERQKEKERIINEAEYHKKYGSVYIKQNYFQPKKHYSLPKFTLNFSDAPEVSLDENTNGCYSGIINLIKNSFIYQSDLTDTDDELITNFTF